LVSNPRVWKEANALDNAGFKVSIFSIWYSIEKLEQDYRLINSSIEYKSSFNLIPLLSTFPLIFYAKALKRFANYFFRFLNLTSIYQEVYLPRIQLKTILTQDCDLYICHQESGLLLGNRLIKMGRKVAFDFEDFYSQDYLNPYRPIRLLKKGEAFALKNAEYITCPSKSMAKSFQFSYPVGKTINVIYNSFPNTDLDNSSLDKITNSLLWFSQTIGPGRGIEELIKALNLLHTSIEIHFVGKVSDDYRKFILSELSKTNHSINFVPLLLHADLINYISRFDIGLAIELSTPASRSLTLTNKILLYLQMNLKVVASKTIGQLELQESFPNQIKYVDLSDIQKFTEIITDLVLSDTYQKNDSFDYRYSWDASEKKLVKLVDSALQN
jgi:hypothetical protein